MKRNPCSETSFSKVCLCVQLLTPSTNSAATWNRTYNVIQKDGLNGHRQPICSNWWFERQMFFLIGGWMLKRRQNARCTTVADSVLMNSRTQTNLVLH